VNNSHPRIESFRAARSLLVFTVGAAGFFGTAGAHLQAQVVTVGGQVRDESGNSIPRARVELSNHAGAAATDSLGAFQFAGVTPGRHRLQVRQIGYHPADTVIDATLPRTSVDIRLRRNVQGLAQVVVRGKRQGIFGAVGAATTLQPLPNTNLRIIGITSVTTDSLGQFAIGLTRPGSYVLRFEREGFAPRTLSLDVEKDQARELIVTMVESTQSDPHLQRHWREFDLRTKMSGQNAAMVPAQELGSSGKASLGQALQRSRSVAAKNLRLQPDACVFVDGEPRPGLSPDAFVVEDVLAVEVYGRNGDLTKILKERWPEKVPCFTGSGSAARRRGKNGFGPMARMMESAERATEVEMVVVWLKHE
jgi:hypothetical protein